MDEKTINRIKQLNTERTWASELIAAVGQFLDKAQGAQCPKLKKSCDELITCGLAMISHHTEKIVELRSEAPELTGVRPQPPPAKPLLPMQKVYVTRTQGFPKKGGRR